MPWYSGWMRRRLTLAGLLGLFYALTWTACGSFEGTDQGLPGTDADTDAAASDAGNTSNDAQAGKDGSAKDAGTVSTPTTLAKGFSDLAGVVATDSTVYFVERNAGKVHAVPIDGDGGATDFAVAQGTPSSIVVTATEVFWGDQLKSTITHQLMTDTKASIGATNPTKGPISMGLAPGRLVVVAMGPSNVGELQQWGLDITAGTNIGSRPGPFDVAVDASSGAFYWTEPMGGNVFQGQATTANMSTFAMNEDDCASIASDSFGVYWARPSGGLIRGKLNGAAAPVTIADKQNNPIGLAADTSGVYWMTLDGTVKYSDRTQAPPTTLGSGFNALFNDLHIQTVALTSTYVVWITNDGKVLRANKKL